MTNELPGQDQSSSETSPAQVSQVEQTLKGDRNQAIGQMTGGNAIGNVERNAFIISGSTITNLTGEGNINYQEAPNQVRNINKFDRNKTVCSSQNGWDEQTVNDEKS